MKTLILLVAIMFGVAGTLQSAGAQPDPKQGGVAFRFDDNQTAAVLEQLNNVFRRHRAPLSLAINVFPLVNDPACVARLKEIVSNGGEIMDHTPSHSCMMIRFPDLAGAEAVRNDPGVDHSDGKTVFLKYRFNPRYRHNRPMTVSLRNSCLAEPAEAVKKGLRNQDFLVFPDGKVYGVAVERNVYTLKTPYGQPMAVPDADNVGVIRTDRFGLEVTPEAMRLLVKTSRTAFARTGLPAPTSFIIPGGWGIFPSAEVLSQVPGKEFGYTAGDAFNWWSGVYSRPQPHRERFRLSPNWDSLERLEVAAAKKQIADLVAKHRVVIFISHLWANKIPGGMEELLRRNDQLLAWLRSKQIPILTMRQCAEKLYGQKPDPQFNLMPPLNVDRDGDGLPDGYEPAAGTAIDPSAFRRIRSGEVFAVRRLSGIEPGTNAFAVRVAAPVGTAVTVKISLYSADNAQSPVKRLPDLKLTTTRTDERLTGAFEVPEWCPGIDVVCFIATTGPASLSELSIVAK